MKKTVLLVSTLLLLVGSQANAQDSAYKHILGIPIGQDSGYKYIQGFSLYVGAGAFPYGLESLSVTSDLNGIKKSHHTSTIAGISFFLRPRKIFGFCIEGSFNQGLQSNGWIPVTLHPPSKSIPILRAYSGTSYGFNYCILFGGQIKNNLEIHARVGVGTTIHTYDYSLYTYSGGIEDVKGAVSESDNFQIGIQMKYFPTKYLGIMSTASIAFGSPVFFIGLTGRLK